ncbi:MULTISPECIES: glycosyltransferase family 2 protein [Stenotrophomonas]|jgi:glycosyltransferase involved in cell wall biosynthesis|uniref:glycosyltransferase family 2 protein n=1 Tax=Stenotrophomonas TaxID=40323 RepID=UPI0032082A70
MSDVKADKPRQQVAVVIPCYKVRRHILGVIDAIGPEVDAIYCVDDRCPDASGDFIEQQARDTRVVVLRHEQNQGVGGAVMTGYQRAIADGMSILVKVDGDGQMDPTLVPLFIGPILKGQADYTKGNRFWDLSNIRRMPLVRRIGNLGLSFMTKASTGYWDVFDPTNGYTAIHANVAARLPFASISRRYFFETDILFRLNIMRAVVCDVPMDATYGDEESNLKIGQVLTEFSYKHARNLFKRIGYRYFLRDLSIASFELLAGLLLLVSGVLYGGWHWWQALEAQQASAVGTVVLPSIAVVSGLQFLLAFIGYDIASVPRQVLHPLFAPFRPGKRA